MKGVVFLGPSLRADVARALCKDAHIDILPPARMGDVFRAVERGETLIGLIDGLFEQTPAVWHKEVLYAIDRGVAVIGGSSMGALRAAELHSFGMVGVGRIFDDYASGALNDDDEVALVHGTESESYTSHSEAMVNLRYGLRGALHDGIIDASLCKTLISFAKAHFYPERCWDRVLAHAHRCDAGAAARLKAYLEKVVPNQKRDDAITVIKTMLGFIDQKRPAPAPRVHFEATSYWDAMVAKFSAAGSAGSATQVHRLTTHVRLTEPVRARLLERGLLLHLALAEAGRCGVDVGSLDARTALEAFRRVRGLNSPDQSARWMTENDVDPSGYLELARIEMLLSVLGRLKTEDVNQCLVKALKLEGLYRSVANHVAKKWTSSRVEDSLALLRGDEATLASALAWYQDKFGAITGDLEKHLAGTGLSVSEFFEEVLVEYLYATEARDAENPHGDDAAE